MKQYSVKKLAKLAGVSVRTLHHYDQIGLLKPTIRTTAGYRLYGETELLRLQQILFYKELDFELKAIGQLLDRPDFDLIEALEGQKKLLLSRRKRINTLVATLEKTMFHLTNKTMMNPEELYEGLPKEQAAAWRREAQEKWPEQVAHGERELMKLSKADFEALQRDFKRNFERLATMSLQDPQSPDVQAEVAQHHQYILKFWGKADDAAAAYRGLGDLYANDPRYTQVDGVSATTFGTFLQLAIHHYVDTQLLAP